MRGKLKAKSRKTRSASRNTIVLKVSPNPMSKYEDISPKNKVKTELEVRGSNSLGRKMELRLGGAEHAWYRQP